MSWQVGDLALCVNATPHPDFGDLLRAGRVYRVIGLPGEGYSEVMGRGFGLLLEGVECPAPKGFASSRFRKIKPDEHEACEPEFVVLLNRTKRAVEAELGAIASHRRSHASHEAPAGLRRPGFDQLSQGDAL